MEVDGVRPVGTARPPAASIPGDLLAAAVVYVEDVARYLPGPIAHSPEGHPIYILEEDNGVQRHVVVRPDGRFFCDERGNVLPAKSQESTWAGLLIGGALGALFGPWGALAGAAIGAVTGSAAEKAKGA